MLAALLLAAAPVQVAVFGTIGAEHRVSKTYSLQVLRQEIAKFNPDLILMDWPAESNPKPPEFDAVKSLNRPIEWISARPADAEMKRDQFFAELQNDPSMHMFENEIKAAQEDFEVFRAGQKMDDPVWIHSEKFDAAVKKERTVFNTISRSELGPFSIEAEIKSAGERIKTAVSRPGHTRIAILCSWRNKYWVKESLNGVVDFAKPFGPIPR